MEKKVSLLTIINTLSLLLMVASGFVNELMASVIYILEFALPIALAICFSKDSANTLDRYLTIDKVGTRHFIPLICPAIVIVMVISFITSYLMKIFTGITYSVDVGDSLVLAILNYALIPAILEELLFRYIPMRLLAPYSKRGIVIISALFFALIHHNFFVIPYAFVAGVIFMVIDISTESIIPSIIIHFINNATSVGMIMYGDNPIFSLLIYLILGIAAIISLVVIVTRRFEYKKMLSCAMESGEKIKIVGEMLLFAVISLMIAYVTLI